MTCEKNMSVMKITAPLKRCSIVTVAILLVGLGSAVAIFLAAVEVPPDPFAEFEKSKKFAYELERMGGKAALAANDLNKWFAGLWQGETLAYTVAVITLVIAAGYYVIATGLEDEARMNRESSFKTGKYRTGVSARRVQ